MVISTVHVHVMYMSTVDLSRRSHQVLYHSLVHDPTHFGQVSSGLAHSLTVDLEGTNPLIKHLLTVGGILKTREKKKTVNNLISTCTCISIKKLSSNR